MTGPAQISVHGVRVTRAGRRILDDVSIDIEAGEWLAIVGANGAGKSTLIRIIAGVVAADSGRLSFASGNSRRARSQHVAYLPQQPTMPDDMRVGEYVALGRYPHLAGMFARLAEHDRHAIGEALELLALTPFADRRLATLSGGERQRVSLARVVAQQASVLLLDEPTSALDIGHRQTVHDVIYQLRSRRSLTVLSVMHDLTLAAQHVDRILVLHDRHVAACGSPHDVLREESIAHWFGANVQTLYGRDGSLVVAPLRKPIQSVT